MEPAGHFGTALENVSFEARAGEIFGIAGVAGNGQNELLLVLDGEIATPAGAIKIDGSAAGELHPSDRRKRGLCAVPEERNGHAAVGDFTLSDNAVLTARDRLGMVSAGLIRAGVAKTYTGEVIVGFAVKALGPGATAGSLSGGNLQKFIMGREILQKPSVLVVNQPTWGVDAGAAAAIHQSLVDLAAQGSAIVVISQDLDELLSLCDTIAVINEGRLSQKMIVGEVSRNDIGLLMGGVHGTPEETHIQPGAAHAATA
jgi:simple sugar transport system ATP-binding protein